MDPLTYEAINRDPQLIWVLMAQARRERAREVHRLIVEPIKSFFSLGHHHAAGTDLAAARKG